ncbi:hypothetical protein [Bacteroides sp. 519]|uniref:hypothetical protein n=1 Tax=Bacteroides sp. 519 TaxID=2302937 RepID=UPI0013D78DAB|nr:hypothetical protein [Bacteroides sp. 519]NDV57622.1 hypothetical protein [Bacteroides sp. 519]
MLDSLKEIDFGGSIFVLFFLLIFISGISLFHTAFVHRAGKKLKPSWLLFAIYNLVATLLFFIHPGLTVGWLILLFGATFVVAILATILGVGMNFYQGVRKILTNKSQSLYKRILTLIVSALCICLFFTTGPFFFIIAIIGTIIYSAIWGGSNRFNKLQAILPTSKIRSMAMGLVEVEGKVRIKDQKLVAPIESKQCIGYHYTIESISRDKDGDKRYSTIHDEKKCNRFFIEDETGMVEVDTDKLDFIMFGIDERYSTSSRRYTQYALYEGDEMLLIGKANLENNTPIITHEEIKNVFGIAPVTSVNRWNRFKPLRSSLILYLMAFGFLVGMILILSIKEVDGMIVVSLPQNIFSWTF